MVENEVRKIGLFLCFRAWKKGESYFPHGFISILGVFFYFPVLVCMIYLTITDFFPPKYSMEKI